jgi:hypothetical protein
MPLDNTLALEHVRRLNFEATIQTGLPTVTLYDTLSFDPESIIKEYRYSGKIHTLKITADRYIRLRFWVQMRSGRRVTIAEINNYDETPLQGAIAAGLYIGHGSVFGVTCLDSLAEGQTVEVFGLVEERGTVVPTGFGEAPPQWGSLAGDITMQADLVQALATKASMVQVEETIDAAILGSLQESLAPEAQARASGDANNAQSIATEAQARADGDEGLNTALVIEVATRSQADQALAQQISTANESRQLRPDRAYTAPPDPNICPRWREISSGGLPLYDYYWVWVPQISRWASEVPLWLSASSGRLTQRESEGNLTGPILGLETWLGTGTLVVSKHTGAYNFALRRYTRYDNVRSTLITKNLPRTVGNSTPETFSLEINQILPLGYWRLTWAMDIDPSAGANQQQDAGISVSLPLRLLRP